MRDTIDMAREARIRSLDNYKLTVRLMSVDTLKAFEALVRADEREACAKVFDGREGWMPSETAATAIRARGNT
jgi:hypothetical protein